MTEQNYTNATVTNSTITSNVIIAAQDMTGSATIILTRDEFLGKLKTWLRTMDMEQRQMIIDELTATTLRTLE